MTSSLTVEYIIENKTTLLAELHRRQAIIRDYVRSVAGGYSTGLYLYGPPGTAKTHTVRKVFATHIKEIYTYKRGHVTPLGLFELLAEHRDEVIVLDDLSNIFASSTALQVLLAALEHPTGPDRGRRVEYRRQGQRTAFNFRGGVIAISNLELHDDELLNAFKSRVHVYNYRPADAQLGALMLAAVDSGWPAGTACPTVPPATARDVATFVIGELIRLQCRFDLRLLFNKALPDYQQWKDGEAETDWQDLVTASIEEHLVALRHEEEPPASREARLEEERGIVREIVRTHSTRAAQVQAWVQRTGKSDRAFYRRKAEIDNR